MDQEQDWGVGLASPDRGSLPRGPASGSGGRCGVIAPNVPFAPGHPEWVAAPPFPKDLPEHPGWLRCNRRHWLADVPDFQRFFFSQCFTEPESKDEIEHFLRMGWQTRVRPDAALPVMVIHTEQEAAATRLCRTPGATNEVVHRFPYGNHSSLTPPASPATFTGSVLSQHGRSGGRPSVCGCLAAREQSHA